MSQLRCNICDEFLELAAVPQHVSGRSHSIRRKVAEFNEMNAQFKRLNGEDISSARAWIRDLYKNDFLTKGAC